MKNGFIVLVVLLLLCATIISLAVMSENISNAAKLTPNDSISDSAADHQININTASAEVLVLLPGIGEELANRIIDYREQFGRFETMDDLQNVPGIGSDTLNKIRKLITLGG